MRSSILGFALGVAWLQMQATLPPSWAIALIMALAGSMALWARFLTRFVFKIPALMLAGALAGFGWAALYAQHFLAQELPKAWEGRDVTVIGTIDSLPYYFKQGVRFNFALERVLPDGAVTAIVPPKLSLAWYGNPRGDETQSVAQVQPGERWQLTVRLRRPHGNANPYAFDYEAWLLEQGVRATGQVRVDASNRRLDAFVLSFGNVVEKCRGKLRERILAALPGKEYAGVIVALVVGDQRSIDQSDWRVFNRTGIGHLISISGLHITMIAGLFASLIFGLWRRSFFTQAQLPAILPAQKAAAIAGVCAALIYVLLAGFGVPAQRTLYMLTVVATALWLGRLASVSHVLCVALGVVLLLDPWALLWPGFWLSFGAVAAILFASVGRVWFGPMAQSSRKEQWVAAIKSAGHTQYIVTLGLVPLTMLLFGQISLVSPLANAVAIPLISFIVAPLALVGSVMPAPFAAWLLALAHWVVEWLALGLNWLSQFPVAVWTAPIPSFWIFILALLGTFWLLAPRGWPVRWLGLLGWTTVLFNLPARPSAGQMWVTAFDVGQGMALLIETPNHRLLYDTGPVYSPESDGANRVILPYLKARGIEALDGVIVSHSDNDHSGGALSILKEVKISWVASSLAQTSPIVQAAPQHRRCVAGQAWSWDGVQFEMLHPTESSYDSAKWKPNARSCSVKITLGKEAIFLAGDIEAVQESELVERSADKLRATVLLAPHHGSGTSSSELFLQTVKPEIALFQVGYRNRYHHPKPEVFERYGQFGIQRLRSDESGAITLQFGETRKLIEYRTDHARYWYGH